VNDLNPNEAFSAWRSTDGYRTIVNPDSILRELIPCKSFFPMSSGILYSGQLKKSILLATPISDTALIVLLRQALAEWSKGARGYEKHLYSLDPVAIRLQQHRVNAPSHADWQHVTCHSCGDKFALGYNRTYGDKAEEAKYLARFEGILADEHKQSQSHRDAYELGD
jgi:hypothetical protein